MSTTVTGFDFFLQQIKPELQSITQCYFSTILALYQQATSNIPTHLLEVSRRFSEEKEKALYISAIEQLQQYQKQMNNTFAFHLLESMQIITGENTGQMSAAQVKTTYDSLAQAGRVDEIELKQLGDHYLHQEQQALALLQHTLESVLAIAINSHNNPFSPIYLCNGIYFSLRIKGIHSIVKQQVIQVINQTLFAALPNLYQQLITLLKQQHLIPHDNAHAATTEATLDLIDDEFNEMLIHSIVPADFSGRSYIPLSQTSHLKLSAKALDKLLKQIQKGYDPITDGLLIDHVKKILTQEAENEQLQVPEQQAENLMNLISLLFLHLAENTDSQIGALLLRLSVPFTRVILLDEFFFHDKNHPARQFLEKLIQLLQSPFDDGLLFKQVQFYATKLSFIEATPALWQELTEKVNLQLSQQSSHLELSLEQLTQQQQTAETQQLLAASIHTLITEKTQSISKKLNFHYLLEFLLVDIFTHLYQQYGKESIEWNNALHFLAQLIPALDNQPDKKVFFVANKKLTETVKLFNQYLSDIQLDTQWKRYFFEQMQDIQKRLLKGETLKQINDDELKHHHEIDMIIDHYESEKTAQLLNVAIIGYENKRTTPPFKPVLKNQLIAEKTVAKLQQGQWINMTLDGYRTPCFLSYHAAQRDAYIFSNRHYQKLFERSKKELTQDFQTGFASLLNRHTNLVDSMAFVINYIKHF